MFRPTIKLELKLSLYPFLLSGGIGTFYTIDTIYPYAVFKPLQAIALPTAACAAAILDMLGYRFKLVFQNRIFDPAYGAMPKIDYVGIAYPCTDVHSLFLYTIIILVLFKRSQIPAIRKVIYFIMGAVGTYMVNVLRIVTYFIILYDDDRAAATIFHDVYGELYFFTWIFLYIAMIICIQRFMLVERLGYAVNRFKSVLNALKIKLGGKRLWKKSKSSQS